MRNFHVVLADGSERNIKAKSFAIEEGVLEFWGELSIEATESDVEVVVAYGPGIWAAVEVERKDDKGYSSEEKPPRLHTERPQPKK